MEKKGSADTIFTSEQNQLAALYPDQEMILQYVEVDDNNNPTGLQLSFSNLEFEPLGYADLVNINPEKELTADLKFKAKILDSTAPEILIGSSVNSRMILESPYTSKTFSLIKGGWLPTGLTLHSDMLVLPDRCTISELNRRFKNGEITKGKSHDFLDFLRGRKVRINPILFALESNIRKTPTEDVITQQLEEAYSKISSALPLAELVPENMKGLQGIIGIVQDTRLGMEKKAKFLMEIAPLIHAPIARNRRALLWDKVVDSAKKNGLTIQSLATIASLSAVAVSNEYNPAKRLLKLKSHYSPEDAYNALADLRSLELLMCVFSLYPNERVMMCTGDKDLALFWAGIQAYDFSIENDRYRFKFSPNEALFPELLKHQSDLIFDGNLP